MKINIVDFWQQQIDKWNAELKCGFCWSFSAPLTQSAVNIVQAEPNKQCCVQVFLVREPFAAFSTNNVYNPTTGFLNGQTLVTRFQLIVVIPSNMGTNNNDEINGHPTSEGKWETILWRLEQCLAGDLNLAFCEFLGQEQKVTQWEGTQLINFLDTNYTGYRINATFQLVT